MMNIQSVRTFVKGFSRRKFARRPPMPARASSWELGKSKTQRYPSSARARLAAIWRTVEMISGTDEPAVPRFDEGIDPVGDQPDRDDTEERRAIRLPGQFRERAT